MVLLLFYCLFFLSFENTEVNDLIWLRLVVEMAIVWDYAFIHGLLL